MISSTISTITVAGDIERALQQVIAALQHAGMQVLKSFDLRSTQTGEWRCVCERQPSYECSCQMIILLVYGVAREPACLVAYEQAGEAYFSLVAPLGKAGQQDLWNQIVLTLEPLL